MSLIQNNAYMGKYCANCLLTTANSLKAAFNKYTVNV